MMTVPDCGDCPQTDCTDHGKPPNERSRSAEESAEGASDDNGMTSFSFAVCSSNDCGTESSGR